MSSAEILSGFTLSFKDPDLQRIFDRERSDFYKKVFPVILWTLVILAGGLEVLYRALDLGEMPSYITASNFIMLFILIVIRILHTRIPMLNKLLCPLLTVLLFLYLGFLDYDYTLGSIYYS
jgi:hypothetical protein